MLLARQTKQARHAQLLQELKSMLTAHLPLAQVLLAPRVHKVSKDHKVSRGLLVQMALMVQQALLALLGLKVQQVLMVRMEQQVQPDLKGRKALLVLKVHKEIQV